MKPYRFDKKRETVRLISTVSLQLYIVYLQLRTSNDILAADAFTRFHTSDSFSNEWGA